MMIEYCEEWKSSKYHVRVVYKSAKLITFGMRVYETKSKNYVAKGNKYKIKRDQEDRGPPENRSTPLPQLSLQNPEI